MWGKSTINILIALGVGFIFTFGCHFWIWRRRPSSAPRVFLLKFIMAVGMAVSILVFVSRARFDREWLFFLASLTVFIDMCYVYVYSAVCRSVSLTLLINLLD